jgi:hypothetical protein
MLHNRRCAEILRVVLREKAAIIRTYQEALSRTRTVDPLLTMEVLYQLS